MKHVLLTLFVALQSLGVTFAEDRAFNFIVAQDGSGDFRTVQEAINAVPDMRKNHRTWILVREGVYKEKIVIAESKQYVALVGEGSVVITYDDFAKRLNVFGEEKGTSGSASFYIYGNDFYAENITFQNSAGPVGQAVACFINGDRAMFRKCRFLGHQDTLYNYGKQSRQYFEDCYIEGTVDFIFGWSEAVFNRCQIHSLANGYVTAPSTLQGRPYGYIFYDCNLTAESDSLRVYLSRPWRPYGQTVYIRCNLGKHILPAGWDHWGKESNKETCYYAEYQSTGPGAAPDQRVPYSHQLSSLDDYDITKVLSGTDGWNPVENGYDQKSIVVY